MNYQISRNGQTYGPYTLDDLKRYLASGNVLPNDLAKSEEMTDWLPVSQILSQHGAPSAAQVPPLGPATQPYIPVNEPSASFGTTVNTGAGTPYSGAGTPYNPPVAPYAALNQYPDAPNLHWALVMLFSILTCTIFMTVWSLIVTAWLRRVQPNANAFYIYIVHAFFLLLMVVSPGPLAHHHHSGSSGGILFLLWWLANLVALFSERASLQEHFNGPESTGLVLNPVMTFFFGGLYFQYHLTRINALKAANRYGWNAPFA